MRLWDYLKMNMTPFKDRIAFRNLGLTYAEILSFDNDEITQRKIRLCGGKTREIQALNILIAISEGEVVVPVSKEHGARNYNYIKEMVENNEEDISDLSFIMFTSGTTGYPKGVMLTDENIISNLEYIKTYFDVSKCKNICIARPLVHIAVLTGELLYALCNGLTIHFYEEPFMPKRLLSYLENNQIDIFGATPTIYHALAKSISNIPSLKVGVISGEVLSERNAKFISSKFKNTNFYNVYGLTEHSPRVSALLPHEFVKKAGSVGRSIGNVRVKIDSGELLVKSDSVMKGYYKDQKQTNQKIKNGWLHTGDIASMTKDGYLYVHGRMDNMIIRAGINIYPEEIEVAVNELEEISDSVVFKVIKDDQTYIYLNYIGDITEDDLRKKLVSILNPNIIPNKIQKVETIAKTASGKKVRR